jgi:hypothetical protein
LPENYWFRGEILELFVGNPLSGRERYQLLEIHQHFKTCNFFSRKSPTLESNIIECSLLLQEIWSTTIAGVETLVHQ